MALVIKVSGEMTNVDPQNGHNFSRFEIYDLIGCEMIEIVRLNTKEEILIIDEEGQLNGKIINQMASDLFKREIVGDALMCNSHEVL